MRKIILHTVANYANTETAMNTTTNETDYKKLAEELHDALASLTCDVRSWTRQMPSRAEIVIENIRDSKVSIKIGKKWKSWNCLEYAEHVAHEYRKAHPESWDAARLAACVKNHTPIGTAL